MAEQEEEFEAEDYFCVMKLFLVEGIGGIKVREIR
jgi:hypothetical protein